MIIDRGFVNAVVFLDVEKGFDTIDHNILLTKLQFYGIYILSRFVSFTRACLLGCIDC